MKKKNTKTEYNEEAVFQKILEMNEEEISKLRGYSVSDAHILAETLKAEEPEEIDPDWHQPKAKDVSDLGLDWDKYPVEDDIPDLEDETYNELPFEERVFIDELSAYLDELVSRINPGGQSKNGIPITQPTAKEEADDDGYNFIKERHVEPQEVLKEENILIRFQPPVKYLDFIVGKRQIDMICQCLVCMRYISNYDLDNFHNGEIWITFDPIEQTHGAKQMAIDCIANGIIDMPGDS